MPFADNAFDVVMSCVGVMFAPHHQEAADELIRVVRPGGTIALISWTPEGFIGNLFATMKPYAPPPPAGASSPPLWGAEDHMRELFGDRVGDLTMRGGPSCWTTVGTDRVPRVLEAQLRADHRGVQVQRRRAPDRVDALDRDFLDFLIRSKRGGRQRAFWEAEYSWSPPRSVRTCGCSRCTRPPRWSQSADWG